MRKLATRAQQWAKNRNWAKFRIHGMLASASNIRRSGIMFETEQKKLAGVERVLQDVLDSWDTFNALSKGQYLDSFNKK